VYTKYKTINLQKEKKNYALDDGLYSRQQIFPVITNECALFQYMLSNIE
jgi:hypothetical protein